MSNVKISALPSATLPLAGTEAVPLVQSGVTVQAPAVEFGPALPLTVADGGTGITSGTSGGVPYFSASGTIASSGALTINRIVLGGGAGAAPTVLGSAGTTTTLLHGNAAGAPTFGAVSLTADVTGTLGVTHGGSGLATFAQGDLIYGSASDTLSALSKSATATRYLANTGASNNPAWDQVNLANGVTGNLPVTNLNSGTSASNTTFWRGDGTWVAVGGAATTGSWAGDFTGFVTVPTTATVNYVIANGLCTLFMNASLLDQGDGTGSLVITNLPPAVRPASECIVPCLVRNNQSFTVPAGAFVEPAGTIEFALLTTVAPPTTIYDVVLNTGVFTAALVIGFEGGWSITYPL